MNRAMWRLFRWLLSLSVLAVCAYLACTVPLGKRTLYGHLRAIFATPEAKDLASGTKQEARDLIKRAQKNIEQKTSTEKGVQGETSGHPKRSAPPLDPMDEKEQQALEQLVHEKAR